MKSNERTTHPAGSLGPGARRNLHRTERHCTGNAIRVTLARHPEGEDWDALTPKLRRDHVMVMRHMEVC